MDEGATSFTILDAKLTGDTSSAYTASGMSDGPNAMVLPSRKKKLREKVAVQKLPGKRALRALAHQKTKERLKTIRSEVSRNLEPLSKNHEEAIRLLSHLLNTKLSNTKFEELYNRVAKSGAKIPEKLQKKHEKILTILQRTQEEEEEESGEDF